MTFKCACFHFAGIFAGCSVAFLVAYVVFLHLHGLKMIHDKADMRNLMFMGSYFPIFRLVYSIISSVHTMFESYEKSISRVVDKKQLMMLMQHFDLDCTTHVYVWMEFIHLGREKNQLCIYF